ncbi:MAG: dienelactone hydrolase family protein [bacterium]
MICGHGDGQSSIDTPLPGKGASWLHSARAARRVRRVTIAGLIAALLVAVAGTGAAAAEPATVQIPSSASRDVTLSATLHRPARQGRMPAVVLMHGCDGWSPAVLHALEKYAEFFVGNGFVVLNLNSFRPRGYAGGIVCDSDRQLARALRYRTQDAFDALDFLREQPFVVPEDIFLMGQSNGGSVSMLVAARQRDVTFRGAVALYPWCGAIRSLRPQLAIPLLILGGERDDWLPPQKCQRMETTGAELRVKVYEDAAHSFDIPVPVQRYLGKRIGFNRSVAEDSRNEMTDFFGDHLQKPATQSADFLEHMPATVEAGLAGDMRTLPP